ncbi:uracil phosphoribosyltransferase, variant [Fonsecaea monophora]|uniref:uracil phosphoribosyltransferase n=1 Tax=Fonsecaea monophora TaxID=254056 RepID=A0A177FG56_9EURO|nr:uracil phosphoribosyltransferase, variant [Fonsecaea monophora]KAH0842957.1 Uracil phosphoribosyltransferase [Fonsecaea pedrosoi]OAG42452.1 uracil phosphoribosyltransferase, variant [Fonsecaea monophora]
MASSLPTNVHVSKHPCLRAKLSQLRSKSTNARETKSLIHEITLLLGTEALGQLDIESTGTAETPIGYEYPYEAINCSKLTVVPILRSGLGMVEGALADFHEMSSRKLIHGAAIQTLLPDSVSVHHLGLFREKMTLQPVEYYNNLPQSPESVAKLAIVVDPVCATGATACAAIQILRDWGVEKIIFLCVLGALPGIERAAAEWPEGTQVWAGGIDDALTDRGMIKPGLGDVGDRLFLTLGK